MLCRFWNPSSTIISSTSVDKWASRAHQWLTSARYEDVDVPGYGGERQELAQGATLSFVGPLTSVSKATRATPFSLVCGAEVVLPPEVYLKSARLAHFNPEDQAEARELDANLLEERCNTALSNVHKYQTALKKYYNKSVVQRELNIGDQVLKKDIRTKDKHKFSTPWEGPFIIVDIAAPGAYVLAEVDGGMLPNTCNVDQLRKYYV
jgi:hypothetical protein